ncbi:MAG: hypothetical protein MUF43_02650 [Flavobacterium sp.]|jgi:hypothetical protein|nr:hypothetical protein [Flavobacterium sp.]
MKTKKLKKINLIALSKKLLLTFTTFFVLLSCTSNDDEPSSSFTPQNITFTLIGKSYMFYPTNISSQNTIITNQIQWDNMLNQLNPNLWGDPLVTTSIDFNSFCLIVVIDSVRPDTGFSINITDVVEYESNIRIIINSKYNSNVFNAASQPFHIVKIPIQTKPFVFQ